jgi:SAM-dependent methyltransferase
MDSEEWDRRYADHELVWSAGPNQFVESFALTLKPGSALDLGAGEGRNAIWLAERGWDVTAVDFSKVGLAKAEEVASRRNVKVHWAVADLTRFEPGAVFDLVLLAYIQLPHDQLKSVLSMASDALAPNGRLFVIGHDTSNLEKGFGGPPDPERLFTPADIVRMLKALHVERAETVTREVATPEGPRTALDALVVASRG